ncbi:ABC transporter ATP-binding protein [Peribacillus alkalitolerans]|uniref:ABC transporter ATP-binding protein n=1 Tax=Peribacillus alkalitolerans TaxID=1550385 RepID=UPI0013D57BDC|nr:ABC transporter ATP-binding protein [Peribacillus alkalitolerans]
MSKVLHFLNPYKIAVGIALFFMLTELAVELWQPLLMAKIIDEGILKNDMSVILAWGGFMVLLSLVAFVSGILNSFYAAHVSQSFGFDVRQHLFEKVQSFSYANFNKIPSSSLITRLTNDVTQIQNTVFMSLRIMMRAPLLIIGGLVMSFVVHPKLALLLAVVVPILFFFLIWFMNKGRRMFKVVQEKLDGVNSVMQENLAGMKLIRSFLRRNFEGDRFEDANLELMKHTASVLRVMEVTMPVLLLLMNFSILGVLWFGSIEVNTGGAEVGEVVAIVNYSMRITSALSVFTFIIMAFSRARASAERITDVLDTEVVMKDNGEGTEKESILGTVEFQNVSFQYPDTSTYVLNDISFKAGAGETIAILGATGAGKTSLFQLIPRLYDVSEGTILIDQLDVRAWKQDSLRNAIGFVPQDSILFTGTVAENIRWGKDDANMDEIMQAAEDAQIADTIGKLPNEYETKIGQRGVNLSGGQKQRISIARALVRKPRLLLLDDSTSALDLRTEAKLLHALKNYSCTTLIITQKVSTAKSADQILLLEDGRLIEKGTHTELLDNSSLYRKIFESQNGKGLENHVKTTY